MVLRVESHLALHLLFPAEYHEPTNESKRSVDNMVLYVHMEMDTVISSMSSRSGQCSKVNRSKQQLYYTSDHVEVEAEQPQSASSTQLAPLVLFFGRYGRRIADTNQPTSTTIAEH